MRNSLARRFVVYIRALGAEPVEPADDNCKTYTRRLEEQYVVLKRKLGELETKRAREAGRSRDPDAGTARLAAIRRLAYEAADGGLFSPDLAAGIRRVKGVKHLGFRVGNWLTTAEGQQLLQSIPRDTIRGKSDGLRITSRRSCSAEHSAGGPLATLASCGHKKSTTPP